MNKSMFTIFVVFGIVAAWAEKAMEDGKITVREALELVEEIATLIGVPLDFDLSVFGGDERPLETTWVEPETAESPQRNTVKPEE